MVRAFVTGAGGFVGGWLQAHLSEAGDELVVPGEDLDVTDGESVRDAMVKACPDAVYHLAALTHVGDSWGAPAEVFQVNALGTLNVLEAARTCEMPPRVLVVSSAEVYGPVGPERLPLTEGSPLTPTTPYASSKVAAEYLGVQAHHGYGLPVVRVRSFNHAGPGQAPTFALSGLARRIVEAQRDGARVLRVGNLTPRRDFTDVRDVVRAYRLVVLLGEPGEVYNVCSGHEVSVAELVDRLLRAAGLHLELEVDAELSRPVDVPVLLGDFTRLREATGWEPTLELDETIRSVLEYWRSRPDQV